MSTLPNPVHRAVVLLSGGLDSATCLAIAKAEHHEVHALSFRYGQRHEYELHFAQQQAAAQGVASHTVVDINLDAIGGSALTDARIDVPKHDSVDSLGDSIPVTYVPARNSIFLSIAIGLAETKQAQEIFIGVNALDYSGYPDCRPEYLRAFETMANLATKMTIQDHHTLRIQAPLIEMTKSQIVRKGLSLGVDFAKTNSCYDPQDGAVPCGHCDACLLRAKGFSEAGVDDPALR